LQDQRAAAIEVFEQQGFPTKNKKTGNTHLYAALPKVTFRFSQSKK
jgi:hypothetical protein